MFKLDESFLKGQYAVRVPEELLETFLQACNDAGIQNADDSDHLEWATTRCFNNGEGVFTHVDTWDDIVIWRDNESGIIDFKEMYPDCVILDWQAAIEQNIVLLEGHTLKNLGDFLELL